MESVRSNQAPEDMIDCAVVLLFTDDAVNAEMIALSKTIAEEQPSGIEPLMLDNSYALPHVTLAMMSIEGDTVEALKDEIQLLRIPSNIDLGQKITAYLPDDSNAALWIEIASNQEIMDAHHGAMALRGQFHLNHPKPEHLCSWVDDYDKYAFQYYRPHITIGRGQTERVNHVSHAFVTLALVTLGKHCTATKRL